MGCFEGLKAFPQPDGALRLFRPAENARRMARSMEGLGMPPFPDALFVAAVRTVAGRNGAIGFAPPFDPAWKADHFATARAMYLRPFSYAEGGIGVSISAFPYVVVVATNVSSYFAPGSSKATTTSRVRANPGGTGAIKCDANYVASALAKKEAEKAGFAEAIFLDAKERRYLEEGSSSNIFAVLRNGTLVTPSLEDTILPGITRASVIELARESGMKVEERRVSVQEVMSKGTELFATGTAAGITFFESLTHDGRTAAFGAGKIGPVAERLLAELKGIQYGVLPDRKGWMVDALR
jgi:branched-chain amino acid aminotransferase